MRLATLVAVAFSSQWFVYFFSSLVEYMDGHTDVVPGLYECVLSFGGIANYLVWSARPGCLYKSCFCCFESSTGFYTSLEGDVGEVNSGEERSNELRRRFLRDIDVRLRNFHTQYCFFQSRGRF